MRGEHRLDPQPRQQFAQFVEGHAFVAQCAQHCGQSAGLRRIGAALVVATATDAVDAFGQIDHAEVRGEGADEGIGAFHRHRGEAFGQIVDAVALLAALDRGATHGFNLGQQFGRDLFGQHVADHGAQLPHVVAQQGVSLGEFKGVAYAHDCSQWGANRRAYTKAGVGGYGFVCMASLRGRLCGKPNYPMLA